MTIQWWNKPLGICSIVCCWWRKQTNQLGLLPGQLCNRWMKHQITGSARCHHSYHGWGSSDGSKISRPKVGSHMHRSEADTERWKQTENCVKHTSLNALRHPWLQSRDRVGEQNQLNKKWIQHPILCVHFKTAHLQPLLPSPTWQIHSRHSTSRQCRVVQWQQCQCILKTKQNKKYTHTPVFIPQPLCICVNWNFKFFICLISNHFHLLFLALYAIYRQVSWPSFCPFTTGAPF